MWTNIVGGLILLFVATYVVQWFLPRSAKPGAGRRDTRREFAPVLGFLGILLLALSLTEAFRRQVVEAWGLGIALGVILSLGVWVALNYGLRDFAPVAISPLRATIRIVRTFGVPVVLGAIGLYLAVRIVGAMLEMFIAAAISVLIVASAVMILARGNPSATRLK
jgi:hypothetical protein